jgi:hypothetical protein
MPNMHFPETWVGPKDYTWFSDAEADPDVEVDIHAIHHYTELQEAMEGREWVHALHASMMLVAHLALLSGKVKGQVAFFCEHLIEQVSEVELP